MLGKFFSPPGPEMGDRVPPGQHLAKKFPVLTYGSTPRPTPEEWELRVWGLAVERNFCWAEMMAMPINAFTADFHCVTTWSKLDVQWQGIKIIDFMQRVTLDSRAQHVLVHCYGGYTTNLSLEDFVREENFLAHRLQDEPLPADHGGPMRLVVPHLYAWKSAKWINGLKFLESEQLGFWENNGYHRRGNPWKVERYSDS